MNDDEKIRNELGKGRKGRLCESTKGGAGQKIRGEKEVAGLIDRQDDTADNKRALGPTRLE